MCLPIGVEFGDMKGFIVCGFLAEVVRGGGVGRRREEFGRG